MIFEVALCLEVPITILEWTLLYKEQLKRETSKVIFS